MSTQGAAGLEAILRSVLLPICIAAGLVVISGFFFPSLVGTAVSGSVWLSVALVFFAAGLVYIALLPMEPATPDEDASVWGIRYLLRLPYRSWQEELKAFLRRQDAIVFSLPVVGFVLFFLLQRFAPSVIDGIVATAVTLVLETFGWLFLGAILVAVLFALLLVIGPWGDIRLGGPDAEPTYTFPTYFSMFFTAGIAAGIVFWAPAEALLHYETVPPFFAVEPGSSAAITAGLTYTLFHWGFTAWSAYLIVGVPIAYFAYEWNAPFRVSTMLAPVLGIDNLDGSIARVVDALAIFATIGGIGTSVALVVQQFLAGISFQWDVAVGGLGPLVFVSGLTVIYAISAATGVRRGIRRLSALTIVLFGFVIVLLVVFGPRSFILSRSTEAIGSYAIEFLPMSVYLGDNWVANWTVWNWVWWFSWAPFAGLFLAALSKGRRLRTVVLTGVVATAAATMVWFLLVGGTSLYVQHSGRADVLSAMAAHDTPEAVAGFPVFEVLPIGELLIFLFLGLIIAFIVTSADTSTLMVSILASGRGEKPSTSSIVFWAIFQGFVALGVLRVGGVETLQAAAVLTGGPFAVLALIAIVALMMTLRRDERGGTSVFSKVGARFDDVGIKSHGELFDEEKKD